jgi:hypothetical protein
MKEIRITVRCKEDENHAKNLRMDASRGLAWVETLAEILDGTSTMYIYPPGPGSPIGKCAICGGKLDAEIQVIDDAEFTEQSG